MISTIINLIPAGIEIAKAFITTDEEAQDFGMTLAQIEAERKLRVARYQQSEEMKNLQTTLLTVLGIGFGGFIIYLFFK